MQEECIMPNQVQQNTMGKGLTVKDLIVMGVFAALLTVCSMIGGVFFAITPTLTFYFEPCLRYALGNVLGWIYSVYSG